MASRKPPEHRRGHDNPKRRPGDGHRSGGPPRVLRSDCQQISARTNGSARIVEFAGVCGHAPASVPTPSLIPSRAAGSPAGPRGLASNGIWQRTLASRTLLWHRPHSAHGRGGPGARNRRCASYEWRPSASRVTSKPCTSWTFTTRRFSTVTITWRYWIVFPAHSGSPRRPPKMSVSSPW
jgi:hypothetical protein